MDKLIDLIKQKYHPAEIWKEALRLYGNGVINNKELRIIQAFTG